MLVDVTFGSNDFGISMILNNIANGKSRQRLDAGIYLSGHWSSEYEVNAKVECDPALGDKDTFMDKEFGNFSPYGVCDNYQQVLDQCPEIVNSDRRFFISLVHLKKANESNYGGWRWHKWGPYIGTQNPQCEYLYNEPVIEEIYTYHVYEVIE